MRGKIDKYLELTKPKVTLLNLLVGVTCFILAALPSIDLLKLAIFCVSGYLAAGGCGILNCVYDQKLDGMMQRTSKRAIPAGAVATKTALVYGTILTVTGIAASYFAFNVLTAFMMILGLVFYLPVYTIWLKRSNKWNVVIGGAAGCFAGLSGWTAVANALSLTPLLIASVDFLWTPGHLWGLAIKKVKEYRKAGIPMLPVSLGLTRASQITFLFNAATFGASLLLPLFGLAGLPYLGIAAVAGTLFLLESGKLAVSPSESQGFRAFLASMPYLASVMAALMVDKFLSTCLI